MGRFIPNRNIATEILREPRLQASLQALAEEGLAFAIGHVPYDTSSSGPHIRDTLHIEIGPSGGRQIVAGTDHWEFPEFGTSEAAAQPYLRPIIDHLRLRRIA